jgi:hypothetical protein
MEGVEAMEHFAGLTMEGVETIEDFGRAHHGGLEVRGVHGRPAFAGRGKVCGGFGTSRRRDLWQGAGPPAP